MNIFRRLLHLYMDGVKQEQPLHTMSDAVGIQKINDSYQSGYVATEMGTFEGVKLPNGLVIRGKYFVAHRNEWIVLAKSSESDEVGSVNLNDMTYRTIVADADLDRPLDLDKDIWTQMRVNFHGQCRFKIYFQTKMIYRVIEIDDPCRNKETNTLLMKPTCVGFINITAVPGMGQLPNGAYSANIKVFDQDGNDTNYGTNSQVVYVADEDYEVAEDVKWGLVIEAYNLPKDYTRIEMTIVETIAGDTRPRVIDNIYYGEGYFRYVYTGREGNIATKDHFGKMMAKIQHDFKGEGIETHNGAVFLFNVEDPVQMNLQKYVNQMRIGYRRYLVPIEDAKYWPSFRANEKYIFSINGNLTDARRTMGYEFINHNVPGDNTVIPPGSSGNCTGCPMPIWMGKDTSVQTKLFYKGGIPEFEYTQKNPDLEYFANSVPQIVASPGGAGGRSSEENPETPVPDQPNLLSKYCAMGQCERAAVVSILTGVMMAWYDFVNGLFAILSDGSAEPVGPREIELPDCVCSTLNNLDNAVFDDYFPLFERIDTETKTREDQVRLIKTERTCDASDEGKKIFGSNGICYECQGGYWHYVNNAMVPEQDSFITKKADSTKVNAAKGSPKPPTSGGNNESPIDIDSECFKRAIPIPYSEGFFGYWETNEKYPTIIGRDDCEYVYGEYAGKNQRLFVAPGLGKEPHFISFSNGVPSQQEPGNDELQNTFAIVTGLYVTGFDKFPPWVWEKLCKKNPFTIRMGIRNEGETTVLGTGILHGTFGGSVLGETALFPKHALNSLEFYDGHINPGNGNTLRKGFYVNTNAHILHTADFHLLGRRVSGDYLIYELGMTGGGYRHKLYDEGRDPETWTQKRVNLNGATYGININKYVPLNHRIQCIKGMATVPADSVLGKDGGTRFTYSLINKYREKCQYIELEGFKFPILNPTRAIHGSINGNDGNSDESFVGDGIDHEAIIKNVGAHMVTVMRYIPHQYGNSISRPYIPTGIEVTMSELKSNGGVIAGIAGDSWVGPFAYRRTSLVSDKVLPEITREIPISSLNFDSFPGIVKLGLQILKTLFDDFFENIGRILGYEEIGTVPKSHDKDDLRNFIGNLRATMRGGGEIGPPSGNFLQDVYHPHVTSGYIHTILPSDANLNYRATGVVDLRKGGVTQVHRRRLKGMVIDATMPEGVDHERSWLDDGATFPSVEPSKLQMIARVGLNILWTYGVGLYFMFHGVRMIMDAILDAGLFSLFSTVVSIIFAVLFFTIGSMWIKLWSATDLDNKIIDKIIGIEFARPEKTWPRSQGGRWGMKMGRIKFKPEFWKYNPDFSVKHLVDVVQGITNDFDPTVCTKNNRIVASMPQMPGSNLDSFRQFKPNHYLYIPKTYGIITRMVSMGGELYVHTTDCLIRVSYSAEPRNLNPMEMELGRFNAFGKPYYIYGGIEEGYGGNLDPNASYVTSKGYFYFDRMARRLRRFAGSSNEDIKVTDVESFYDENLTFYGDGPYDQKNESGQWFDLGVDYGNNTLYIYKKDIDNKSFMLSLDMNTMKYISRHMWKPELILWDRYRMYTLNKGIIYGHRATGVFGNIHGQQFASYIEIPFRAEQLMQCSTVKNIKIIGEVLLHEPDGFVHETDQRLIDKIQIYDGRHTSGWLTLQSNDDQNGAGTNHEKEMERMVDSVRSKPDIRWTRKGNGIVIEEFYNISSTNKFMNTRNEELNIIDTTFDKNKIDQGDRSSFFDDYFVIRIYFKKPKNIQTVIRAIVCEINANSQD